VSGRAFNLGGGPANAVTLLQVIAEIERVTGRKIPLSFADWRQGDQRYFVADARRAATELGLKRPVPWRDGLARLARFYGALAMEAADGGAA
jgi:CDP-paratose 2-epimerase